MGAITKKLCPTVFAHGFGGIDDVWETAEPHLVPATEEDVYNGNAIEIDGRRLKLPDDRSVADHVYFAWRCVCHAVMLNEELERERWFEAIHQAQQMGMAVGGHEKSSELRKRCAKGGMNSTRKALSVFMEIT